MAETRELTDNLMEIDRLRRARVEDRATIERWAVRTEKAEAEVAVLRARVEALEQERDRLKSALTGLVGADSKEELEQMEMVIRAAAVPAADKAATIDAIHALLAALAATPEPRGENK